MPTELIFLDAYCCAGGATKGYQRAFAGTPIKIVGIDKTPRPRYCGDAFVLADALEFLARPYTELRGRFPSLRTRPFEIVGIHTSPPCQHDNTLTRGTNASKGWGTEHDQLVPPTRELCEALGVPFVIEQPSNGSMIRPDLTLCTDMFPAAGPPPWVQRHRDFEVHGFTVEQPPHPAGPVRGHRGYVRAYRGKTKTRPGFFRDGPYVAAYGGGGKKATVPEMQHALGIDWTDVREELTEALPVWYTEHIGRALRAHLGL
jgi:hypothetical protein